MYLPDKYMRGIPDARLEMPPEGRFVEERVLTCVALRL